MYVSDVDVALDKGEIRYQVGPGKTWSVRRNGRTKLWVKSPDRYRIPIKIGFRFYGHITESTEFDGFVITGGI